MSIQRIEGSTGLQDSARLKEMIRVIRRIEVGNAFGTGLLWTIATIITILFVGIIVYLVLQGSTYLFNPTFYGNGAFGIGPEIFNTFYILILAEVITLPVAL